MSVPSSVRKVGQFLAHPGTFVVVAFLIRYGIFFYYRSQGPYPVAVQYPIGYETGRIARSLAEGLGYSSPLNVDTGPTAWMTPLYPLLLAGVFKVFGVYSWTSFLVITAIDCAVSALTAWVIWGIGRRAFNTACGVTAGWMWALLPSAVFYPVVWVWDTSLSAFMFALIILATVYMLGVERLTAWVGYGALWGAGAMTNASVVSTLPFLIGWLALELRSKSARWLKPTLVALVVFVVVISPWFVRNYVVFHKVILFRSNFGLELWLGNNVHNPGVWSWWLHPNDDDQERKLYARMGEIPYMEMKQREALQWMRAHPGEFVSDTFHRFVYNWIGVDEPVGNMEHVPGYFIVILVVEVSFTLLALLGVLLAYRRRNPYAFPFAAAILFFPLVYYITHTSLRYRHPIDPLMAVLASYTAVSAISWVASLRPAQQAEPDAASRRREMAPAGERLR